MEMPGKEDGRKQLKIKGTTQVLIFFNEKTLSWLKKKCVFFEAFKDVQRTTGIGKAFFFDADQSAWNGFT